MNQQFLQRISSQVDMSFDRISGAQVGRFNLVVAQVFTWFENHPILGTIIQHLQTVPGEHHRELQLLMEMSQLNRFGGSRYYHLTVGGDFKQEDEPEFKGYTPKNFEEHASACLQIVQWIARGAVPKAYGLFAVYLTGEEYDTVFEDSAERSLTAIKDTAIRDLKWYLVDYLSGLNAVNTILLKYKQNVEWFQQERLQEIINKGYGRSQGERALALHLQQYVFEQGVDFTVEPTSASGEADLVLRDSSGQFTIIDAKYIKKGTLPSEITRKIAAGFNQVARYCNDYNQPEGFLAVYVDDDVSIQIDLEENVGFRFVRVGGRIVYYIEINITERPSASKSGKAKQVVISRDDLFQSIQEVQSEESAK